MFFIAKLNAEAVPPFDFEIILILSENLSRIFNELSVEPSLTTIISIFLYV